MTAEPLAIREVAPEPAKKVRTTAGRLRARFEGLIERDQQLIVNHESHIETLRLQVAAWQEAISELNTEPTE